VGVIDERIDLPLVANLADANPEGSVVMVGPTAKLSPGELPRRTNLHYTGQVAYERLPEFLKGFDACLMPFALNQATRSISPTKTLEYMAAGKPIISTPVPDVIACWGDVVWIADEPGCFVTTVRKALAEPAAGRRARQARAEAYLAAGSWDAIADQVAAQIEAGLANHGRGGPA
jgi:glycosyltransferase involved in cell wall biosynthesis